jgi:hypothetical protein
MLVRLSYIVKPREDQAKSEKFLFLFLFFLFTCIIFSWLYKCFDVNEQSAGIFPGSCLEWKNQKIIPSTNFFASF